MFRKLFYAVIIVGVYFWVIGSKREGSALAYAKEVYSYCVKAWEDLDVKWHVHTPSCKGKKRHR